MAEKNRKWRTKRIQGNHKDLERALNEGNPPKGYWLNCILAAGLPGDGFIIVYNRIPEEVLARERLERAKVRMGMIRGR